MVLSSWISPSLEERNDKQYIYGWVGSIKRDSVWRSIQKMLTRQLLSNVMVNLPSWQRIQEPIWAMHDHSWLSTLDLPSLKSCTFVYKTAVSDGVNNLHVLSIKTVPWKRQLWEPFLLKGNRWAVKQPSDDIKYGAPVFIQCSMPKFRILIEGALSCYRSQLKGSKHDIKDLL